MKRTYFDGIDLSSDTATKPSLPMKQAMMSAMLGDEQKKEDPTTNELEKMVADMFGLDQALLLPSATMANIIAVRLLCQPGDELIVAEQSHLLTSEGGGPAVHSGVILKPIPTPTVVFSGSDLFSKFRQSQSVRHPVTKCVSIENTTNLGGGIAWEKQALDSVLLTAQELNLKTHLDGARLFNAALKIKAGVSDIASKFDTVTICLSKGLGCPLGAVLAFKACYAENAERLKHLFGGALRQSGIIAAAGIYALQNNIGRLEEDHENATYLAQRLKNEVPELQIEANPLSTNMVFFAVNKKTDPNHFYKLCIQNGLRFGQVETNRFRAVTHLDITREEIKNSIE